MVTPPHCTGTLISAGITLGVTGTWQYRNSKPFWEICFRDLKILGKWRVQRPTVKDPPQAIQIILVKPQAGKQLVHFTHPPVMFSDFQTIFIRQIDSGIAVLFKPGCLPVMIDMTMGDNDMFERL